MLSSSLNSSPNVICFRDPFNWIIDRVGFDVDGYDNRSAEDRALRNQDFKKFLEERIFCQHPEEIRAVGFKMPYVHLPAFPGLLEWLAEDRELRVLHLQRRNLLRMLVSLRIAELTGGWVQDRERTLASKFKLANVRGTVRHPLRTAHRLRKFLWPTKAPWKAPLLQEPPTLSEKECRAFFEEIERDATHYETLFGEHSKLTVYYEDLLHHRNDTFDRVQSFLGLKPRRLAVTLVRQNPEPLRQLLANYDELYEEFQDTPYAVFFD